MLISVIIPALNEAARIEACLAQFRVTLDPDGRPRPAGQAGDWELLVVDGGSLDATVELADAAGARVIRASRGRGTQMNAGAVEARGAVLLFLHADARLPDDAHGHMVESLADPATALGAFRARHEAERWAGTWKAGILRWADSRSKRTAWPYGDQGLFCRTKDFRAMGGFPDEPLMEEFGLVARLRTLGRVRTVPADILVSGRRFEAAPLRAFLCMNSFPLLYRLGVSPKRLAAWYGAPR